MQVQTETTGGPHSRSPADMKVHLTEWYNAFPCLRFTINALFAAGDPGFVYWTVVGTHTGTFIGIQSTHTSITIADMVVYYIVAGKITADLGLWDRLGFLQQLGEQVPAGEQQS